MQSDCLGCPRLKLVVLRCKARPGNALLLFGLIKGPVIPKYLRPIPGADTGPAEASALPTELLPTPSTMPHTETSSRATGACRAR